MKVFILPIISLVTISNISPVEFSAVVNTDTTLITHTLDGHIAEWPEEGFVVDKATKMRYAMDNDKQMLFLALNVPDKTLQQKIMQNGLVFYVDTKGKKKENHGVEFPLGMNNNPNIEMMKVFGFAGESVPQHIKTAGTINIALAWDTLYVMNIEYHLPLAMLNSTADELNNKKISIGWKINEGEQMPANAAQPVSSTSRIVAVPAGSRPSNNRSTGPTLNNASQQSSTVRPQTIWSSHTITF